MKNVKIYKIIVLVFFVFIWHIMPFHGQAGVPNPDWVRAVTWEPDGLLIAYSTELGYIQVDDMNGQFVRKWNNDSPVLALKWSPDGKVLASGDSNGMIKVWNPSTAKMLANFQAFDNTTVDAISWSPDSTQIAGLNFTSNVVVWTISKTKSDIFINPGDIFSIDWSPDGTKLALERLKKLEIWNPTTGLRLKTFDTPEYITTLAWSPNGKEIATGDILAPQDAWVRIWDAETGALLKEMSGHSDTILSIGWNADGTKLESSSIDKTIRIWTLSDGISFAVYQTSERVFSAVWSPFGGRIAYADIAHPVSSDALNAASTTDSTLKIVVPPLTTSDLKNMIMRCVSDTDTQQRLTANLAQSPTTSFKAMVQTVHDKIPAGCLADITAAADHVTDK